ncbi:MAG: queuosine salvage family protein [Bacteroidota bacterium]
MDFDENVLSKVREQAKWVTERATQVSINHDKIKDYALGLPLQQIVNPPLDPEAHYLDKKEDTLAFFLTLESINFGSGFFPFLEQEIKESGYFTIARALTQHFRADGPIPAADLATISAEACASIFQQSTKHPAMQRLMQLFATALNQLGDFLIRHFNGEFTSLILAAENSAVKLVQLLLQIPYFQDISTYQARAIPILKRAQITAADLSLAFQNSGLGYFKDLDQLSIFADNMLPHVLRTDGIFSYSDALQYKVDHQYLIAPDSTEEVEMRASAIHAVELIKEVLLREGHAIRSIDLDYLLWNLGLSSKYQSHSNLHLTQTIFY